MQGPWDGAITHIPCDKVPPGKLYKYEKSNKYTKTDRYNKVKE
jgi:hypothetical protein